MGKVYALSVFVRKGRTIYYPAGALQQMMEAAGSTSRWYGQLAPGTGIINTSWVKKTTKLYPDEIFDATLYEVVDHTLVNKEPYAMVKNNQKPTSKSYVHIFEHFDCGRSFYVEDHETIYIIFKMVESYKVVNGYRVYYFVPEYTITDNPTEFNWICKNHYKADVKLALDNHNNYEYYGGK